MLLILAPSKTQKQLQCTHATTTTPQLLEKTTQLAQVLKQMNASEIAVLMKTSEKLTQETMVKIQGFNAPFTRDNSHPAIFTFTGDSYNSITPTLWTADQLEYAQKHLITLSGLYGVLRPLDLMQPYRLEMGLKLTTDLGKNMYQFWGTSITECIKQQLCDHKDRAVISLSSAEYTKTIQKKDLPDTCIDIIFKQTKDGKTKTIPIYSKRARGAMANFAITEKIEEREMLKEFDGDGYSFIPEESNATQYVFTCNLDD